ncbi:MAG TPA: YggT family protein [Negativicutes bacterium]|nr:YggT family protein [Negativicutes bacterium]
MRNNSNIPDNHSIPLWFVKTRHTIYFILGVIEVLIGFRFVFKLLGANPGNAFVDFLYSVSGIFTAPFSGIFDAFVSQGLAARSVLEPSSIIGMIVYAVAAWGLVSLFRIKVGRIRI